MDRTQHPSNNQVLGAPPGWNQNDLPCGALPITRTLIDDMPAMASFWRPTADELAAMNAGALVLVWVFGTVHPPIAVGVQA